MSDRPRNRDEARQLVERISTERGNVTAATLAQLDDRGRDELARVVQGMGSLIVNSVRV